jgi:hypothetical protein
MKTQKPKNVQPSTKGKIATNKNKTLSKTPIKNEPNKKNIKIKPSTGVNLVKKKTIAIKTSTVKSTNVKSPVVKPKPGVTNKKSTNTKSTNTKLTNIKLINTKLTNIKSTNTKPTNIKLTNKKLTNIKSTNTKLTTLKPKTDNVTREKAQTGSGAGKNILLTCPPCGEEYAAPHGTLKFEAAAEERMHKMLNIVFNKNISNGRKHNAEEKKLFASISNEILLSSCVYVKVIIGEETGEKEYQIEGPWQMGCFLQYVQEQIANTEDKQNLNLGTMKLYSPSGRAIVEIDAEVGHVCSLLHKKYSREQLITAIDSHHNSHPELSQMRRTHLQNMSKPQLCQTYTDILIGEGEMESYYKNEYNKLRKMPKSKLDHSIEFKEFIHFTYELADQFDIYYKRKDDPREWSFNSNRLIGKYTKDDLLCQNVLARLQTMRSNPEQQKAWWKRVGSKIGSTLNQHKGKIGVALSVAAVVALAGGPLATGAGVLGEYVKTGVVDLATAAVPVAQQIGLYTGVSYALGTIGKKVSQFLNQKSE